MSWTCWDPTAMTPARPAWRSAARSGADSACRPEDLATPNSASSTEARQLEHGYLDGVQ